MLRVHFTADDLARISIAPRPAPLVELKTSLMMLCRRDNQVRFGRWRRDLQRSLPHASRPLWDLISAYLGPAFLDPVTQTLPDGLDAVAATPAEQVRAGIDRIYAVRRGTVPAWLHALAARDTEAWTTLRRGLASAYAATLERSWPVLQDMHRAEFTRYALTAAESGTACALTSLMPGSRLTDGVWQVGAPYQRDIHLRGRGLLLLPAFHWTDAPLCLDQPDQPDQQVLIVYPAGTGFPVPSADAAGDPLPGILGQTRSRVLRLLEQERTTTELARLAGISAGSASGHASALRAAGLVSTIRNGATARHRRTPLGNLLAG